MEIQPQFDLDENLGIKSVFHRKEVIFHKKQHLI